MQGIPRNTITPALRRVSFTLVDATDLFTPEDITVAGVQASLSLTGGTVTTSTNNIVKVNGTNGEYYLELTQAEVSGDAGDVLRGWLKPTGCALTKFAVQLVPAGAVFEPLAAEDIVTAEIAALDGYAASDTGLTIDGVAHTITRNDTDGYVSSITVVPP
jgi:hypothetical protein